MSFFFFSYSFVGYHTWLYRSSLTEAEQYFNAITSVGLAYHFSVLKFMLGKHVGNGNQFFN